MRNLRIATLGLGLVIALAGAAAALHATLNASHSASTDHASASGDGGLDVTDSGLAARGGLVTDHASFDGAMGVTLPAVPEAPGVPDAPALPAGVPDVGAPDVAVPEAPALPDAPSASGSAEGGAGATTEHGSANGAGGVDVGA